MKNRKTQMKKKDGKIKWARENYGRAKAETRRNKKINNKRPAEYYY